MTPPEAARYANLHISTIYSALDRGRIPYTYHVAEVTRTGGAPVKGRFTFEQTDLDTWLASDERKRFIPKRYRKQQS